LKQKIIEFRGGVCFESDYKPRCKVKLSRRIERAIHVFFLSFYTQGQIGDGSSPAVFVVEC
jgi:hypothetical protein